MTHSHVLPFAIRYLLFVCLFASILFLSAGTVRIPAHWGFLLVLLGFGVLFFSTIDADLQRSRMTMKHVGEGANFRLLVMPIVLAHFIIAGMDAGRFHWSGYVPLWVHLVGFAGTVLGLTWSWWAMFVNRYFVPTIVIRAAGHDVIDIGPYRFVRHPGYLGSILTHAFVALALGSYWALVTVPPYAGMMIWRTRREDAFLHEQLKGYPQYAARVRSRLVPYVW